jgi:hypothetical protein
VTAGGVGFLDDEEYTITRTIVNVAGIPAIVTAASRARVAIGLGIFRVEAVAAGVGSLPSPESDPDFEWLYYSQFDLRTPTASQLEGSTALDMYRAMVDVRGQRIVRLGQVPVWLAESQDNNVEVGVGGRYLAKLI